MGLLLYKKYKGMLKYIVTMIISGILYVCLYPAMLNHVFFKYRGREAVHKFLKEGTLFGPVVDMFLEMNQQLFKGYLVWILVILSVITVVLVVCKKISLKDLTKGFILITPALVYFFGISKASPFVTIRYVSPIAPIIFTGMVVWGHYVIMHSVKKVSIQKTCSIGMVLVLFLTTFYFGQKPLKESYFLERKEVVDQLSDEVDYCVYFTGDEYNWKMWEDYVNYPQFQGLFFIDGRNLNPIQDEKLKSQKELVLYIDKALDTEEIFDYLDQYMSLKTYEIVYEAPYTYIVLAKG